MKVRLLIIKKKSVLLVAFLLMILTAVYLYSSKASPIQIDRAMYKETFIQIDETMFNVCIVKAGTENQKIIALTFDDGPHPRFTPQILDLLKEYDAKATFFVLGRHVQLYPEVVLRLIEEGHEVGNHTFTHIDVRRSSYTKIKQEFEDTQSIIFQITGKKPILFRPPFGLLSEYTLQVIEESESKIVLWSENQDPKDWKGLYYREIANHILRNIGNGNIILLHDYVAERESQTVKALSVILPELVEQGYRFVSISELLEISGCSCSEMVD